MTVACGGGNYSTNCNEVLLVDYSWPDPEVARNIHNDGLEKETLFTYNMRTVKVTGLDWDSVSGIVTDLYCYTPLSVAGESFNDCELVGTPSWREVVKEFGIYELSFTTRKIE